MRASLAVCLALLGLSFLAGCGSNPNGPAIDTSQAPQAGTDAAAAGNTGATPEPVKGAGGMKPAAAD